MLSPFLFVGVGGSGGKTLWATRVELLNRLEEAGYAKGIPAAWQFLHIDVPPHPDGLDPELGPPLPAGGYVGLVGSGIVYRTLDESLMAGADGHGKVLESLAGWRPKPSDVAVPVEKGAGQYRTLGRVITLTNLRKVNQAIQAAVDGLQGSDIVGELAEVSRHLGVDQGPLPDPVVVVVSSMAGGSGAGAVLDVCDVLRSTGHTWADRSFGMLYGPDVFSSLGAAARKGVQANALATLSEVMAGFWNNKAPGSFGFEEEYPLFERAEIKVGQFERRGPRYPIIIGGSNGSVTFERQDDVYRATGKALAAWTVNDRIQDHLGAYFEANYAQSASNRDLLPLHENGKELPFSAIGFGRVSLGRDRFTQYSAERLARAAVNRLLRQHEGNRLPGEEFDSKAAISEMVTARAGGFINDSGLDERGDQHNQVLDALRPPDQKAELMALIDNTLTTIGPGREKGASAQEWTDLAVVRINALGETFAEQQRAAGTKRAREFVGQVQERLVSLVERTIGQVGLPVTLGLLDHLDAELQYVLGELPNERDTRNHYAAKLKEHVSEELVKVGSGKILPANPQLRLGVQKGVECLEWRAEAEIREQAIELIKDIKQNLLSPLRSAIRKAIEDLSVEERSQPGKPSEVSMWPEGRTVPARFTPSANEKLLLEPGSYADEFDRQITNSTRAEGVDGALSEAVSEIIVGRFLGEDQGLIVSRQSWQPSNRELASDPTATATPARFELVAKAEALLGRSRRWVRRPDVAFGSFVQEGLASYLSDVVPAQQLEERLSKFRADLLAAVDASRPLVDINPQVLQRTHEQDQAPWRTFFTKIPLPEGTKARSIAEAILIEKGQLTPDVKASFLDGDAERIDMFTVLESPYEPVVFSSIMRPIAGEWAARKQQPDSREEFWRWRRSRPLAFFVPTTPDVRQAMVRGWFLARALGQLKIDRDRRLVSIYARDQQEWVHFPEPLIGPAVFKEYDYLPAVLESLPIAMVEFATGPEAARSMLPYRVLRTFGESGEGSVSSYTSPGDAVKGWIDSGQVGAGPGAPSPIPDLEEGEADPSARCRRLIRYLEDRRDSYNNKLFSTPVDKINFFETPRAWELRTDILNALDLSIGAVKNVLDESGSW